MEEVELVKESSIRIHTANRTYLFSLTARDGPTFHEREAVLRELLFIGTQQA